MAAGTPASALLERINTLLPEGAVAADLLAVLTTKGVKKTEAQSIVDAYTAQHPAMVEAAAAGTSGTPAAPTGGDAFPLAVSLAALAGAEGGRSTAMSMASSMRSLDLSFSVSNLKWNK